MRRLLRAGLHHGGRRGQLHLGGGGGASDPEAQKKLQEAEEQMKRNQQMLEEMTKSYEDRLNEANAAQKAE